MFYTTLNLLTFIVLLHLRSRASTRSADWICLRLHPLPSWLKFSDRSFRNVAPHLRNNLSSFFRSYSSCNFISPTALSFSQLAFSRLQLLSRLKTRLFTLRYSRKAVVHHSSKIISLNFSATVNICP